jgi:phospholipid/cholesterol/gamma-HCH transport system substrate-binding protein
MPTPRAKGELKHETAHPSSSSAPRSAAIVAVFGFVYWLNSTAGLGPRPAITSSDGSAAGAIGRRGVLFNGIRVGEVTGLVSPRTTRRVNATISVASTTPVRADAVGLGPRA